MRPSASDKGEQSIIYSDSQRLQTSNSPMSTGNDELSPIYKLPAELLSQIFAAPLEPCNPAQDSHAHQPCAGIAHSILHIVRISHVCRHWRLLAINNPLFWTQIPISSPQWTDVCLSRCRDEPVTLEIYDWKGSRDGLSAIHDRIGPLLLRARVFHLQCPLSYFESILPLLVSPRAPHLKSLLLDFGPTREAEDGQRSLSSLFAIDMPRLESLRVSSFKYRWLQPASGRLRISPCLRILELRGVVIDSTESLLDILSQSPNLERFELHESDTSESMEPGEYARRETNAIELDKLARLDIGTSLQRSIALLSRIKCPLDCEFVLRAEVWWTGTQEAIEKLCQLCPFDRLAHNCDDVFIYSCGEGHTSRMVSLSFRCAQAPESHVLIPHIAFCEMDGGNTANSMVLRTLATHLSLPNVLEIGIYLKEEPTDTAALRDISLSMPHATTIRLCAGRFQWYCGLLREDDDSQPPRCVPDLRTLQLKWIRFDAEGMGFLSKILEHRRKYGRRLEVLKLDNCQNVSSRMLDLLKGLVGQLDWDGPVEVDDEPNV